MVRRDACACTCPTARRFVARITGRVLISLCSDRAAAATFCCCGRQRPLPRGCRRQCRARDWVARTSRRTGLHSAHGWIVVTLLARIDFRRQGSAISGRLAMAPKAVVRSADAIYYRVSGPHVSLRAFRSERALANMDSEVLPARTQPAATVRQCAHIDRRVRVRASAATHPHMSSAAQWRSRPERLRPYS